MLGSQEVLFAFFFSDSVGMVANHEAPLLSISTSYRGPRVRIMTAVNRGPLFLEDCDLCFMMTSVTSLVVGGLLLAVSTILTRRLLSPAGGSAPHPPGPKGWPIIGNALQIPQSRLWEKALEWSKTYGEQQTRMEIRSMIYCIKGDLVYVENFGKPLLLINSYANAVELLSNRSAKNASRMPFIMAELLVVD